MKKKEGSKSIKRLLLSVLAVLAAAALMTGVTAAWFTNQYRLSSIGKIHPPAYISILAPGDTVMQAIDLSYDKSEVTNGQVELKRPFVIRSESAAYDLCIAHTTNISGLTIKLYEAVNDGSEGNAYLAGITEKGTPYYWNRKNEKDLFKSGAYVNPQGDGDRTIADKDHLAHSETFRLTETEAYDRDRVQKYAEPLYWVKKDCTATQRIDTDRDYNANDKNYYTNYILEISWLETDKETDILYVIAQANSDQTNNGNS